MVNKTFKKYIFTLILLVGLICYQSEFYAQTIQIFNTVGTQTWTCPVGVTSVTVECWGGGGGGGGASTVNNAAAGGGGGGAYASSVISVAAGNVYTINVGAGGSGGINNTAGTTGMWSSFNSTVVRALGGDGGGGTSSTIGGIGSGGGAATSCTGTFRYSGGNGATGTPSLYAGGGGSSAGAFANGNNANTYLGGTAPTGGGSGATSSTVSTGVLGTIGSSPGGGGSGGRRGSGGIDYAGGAGGPGKVALSYCTLPITASASATTICSGSTSTLTAFGPLTLDQYSNTGASTGYWSAGNTGQQTFIAGYTGLLRKIRLQTATYGSASGNIVVNLYAGAYGSGTFLKSLTYTKPANTNSWDDIIIPGGGVNLTAGSPYYIEIPAGPSIDWIYSSSNSYVNGSAYYNGTNYSWDWNFETYIDLNTYVWNPGALSNPEVAVSPTITTNHTVTVTNTLSCTNSQMVTVNVDPTSVGGTASANQTICIGQVPSAILLTGFTGAIQWQSSPNNSTWTNITGATTNVLSSAQIGALVSTTYYRANVISGLCAAELSNIIVITVNPFPIITATSSSTAICVGFTASLTATGAVNYTWNPGSLTGTLTSGVSNLNVSPSVTTVYTVAGTSSTGCTNTQTVSLTVNNNPTVTATSSPTAICVGASANLTAAGASTYTWNPGPLTGSLVSVSPSATTIYTLTGASAAGCLKTQTVSLIVNPNLPLSTTISSSSTTICSGTGVSFFSTETNSGTSPTYQWQLNGSDVSGATYATYSTNTLNDYDVISLVMTANEVCTTNSPAYSNSITMTVNPNLPLSTTISSSSTTICSGTGVSFFSTETNSGTSPTYQWQLNGSDILGATYATYSTNTLNDYDVISLVMTSNEVCTTNSPAYSNSITMTVNPNLPLSTTISSSSTTICSGTGVSFFSTETNSGTSPTYQWQLNGSDISGATYATYSTNTLNDYDVISLVMTANEVCAVNTPAYSNSITMTVNPNPVLSLFASSFSICEGSASTLSASGANSFTWTPSLLVGSIITVTPTINTTYVVEGENGSGCFATDSISIVVNALPVAIASLPSSDTICYNGAVGLALNSQADVTYNWSSSYGASINAQNPTFTNVTNIGNVYYYGSVTDINGCVSLYDTVLVVVTPSITLSALTTNVSCFGSTNGSINLSVLGGFAPYSYSWSNSVLTEDLSLLATGNYSVTVIDATACSNTLSVLVNEPSQLIANAIVTTSIACNGGDAIVAVSATGGTGSFTGTGTYTVAAGNYTYTVTDANGCASNFTINIAEPQPLIINASATSSNICDGQSVNLTATGALTYTWNNSVSNGVSFTPTATANYIVIGTDINGCIGSETISITVNTLPIVIANTSSTIICIGQPLTLTGGGTATTYSWTNGVSDGIAFTPTINNSYIVTGIAVNGCSNSDTIDITLNQLPSLSIITSSSSICAGETSILTATGANTYLWNNGVSTSSLVVSPSTTTVYTLTGTSVFGCSNTQTVIINVNTLPIIFASSPGTAQPIPSYISTSGLIAWYPFNGNSNDESGNALNGIVSGATLTSDRFGVSNQSYSFNGLTDNISVPHNSILNSYPLTISCWIKTDASFSGGNILKKYLNASWNGWYLTLDSVSNDLAMIIPHYLRSSSPCNGIVEGYGICGNPVGLNHKGSVNDLNWHSLVFKVDNIGGTLYLDGQPVGQQNWIGLPGGVTSTIQMLIGQNFKGKIDDIGLWNRALTNQEITDLYTATSPSICSGVTTTLTSSGANSYTWNPGSLVGSSVLVNPTINTTFTITGINSAGCSNTKTLSLIVNPLPQIIASASSNSVCAGNTISLTGSGSITNYTWTNGVNNGVAFTPTISSTYIVTGIGVNGCSNSDTLDVTINSLPSLSLTAFPSSICAGSSATLSALGATTYSWSTGSSLSTIFESPIANTIYTVIGTDIVGCVNTETLSLTVNALPSLTISPSSNSVCVGNSATLTAVGANTYSWSTGATTSSEVVSPTATTIYTVVGIDAIGCSNWDTLRVFANSLPNIITNVNTNTVCLGGAVVFSNLGATTFTLNPSAFTGSLISVPMNTVGVTNYTVTGTGPLGCSNTVTVSLTTLDIPTVLISPSSNTICSGQSVILNASGANTYTWSNSGTVSFSITDVPSSSTSYSVIGLDINGCSNSASTTVNVSNTPSVSISSPSTNVCSGYTMGISASGALSYIWSTGAISNSINVQPFINTTYSVVGSNGSTCTDTAFWTLTVLPLPSVIANASSTLICDGQSVTLTGGGSASTYTWTNGVNDGIAFTPTVNNTYQVTGIDLNGCNSNSTIIVDVYYGTTAIPSANPRVICIGDTSFLSVIGGSIPTWSLNSNPNILSVAPMSDVSYTYSAVDNNGCVGDIIFNISIDEACAIAVYNGLTPNGDGINDFWIIDNIENYSNNKVYIYNRWGNKVFQTSNYNNAENVWDGKFNGQVVPSGTYFYVIESNELIKKGWIEITN